MAKRRNHRASAALEGRSERPATGMGSSERGGHEIPIAYAIGLSGAASVRRRALAVPSGAVHRAGFRRLKTCGHFGTCGLFGTCGHFGT